MSFIKNYKIHIILSLSIVLSQCIFYLIMDYFLLILCILLKLLTIHLNHGLYILYIEYIGNKIMFLTLY